MLHLNDELTQSKLTAREREILQFAASGLSFKEIAQQVEIAPRTVERHIENVRNKLRARNKSHMIAKAVALGILRLDCEAQSERSNVIPLRSIGSD